MPICTRLAGGLRAAAQASLTFEQRVASLVAEKERQSKQLIDMAGQLEQTQLTFKAMKKELKKKSALLDETKKQRRAA